MVLYLKQKPPFVFKIRIEKQIVESQFYVVSLHFRRTAIYIANFLIEHITVYL